MPAMRWAFTTFLIVTVGLLAGCSKDLFPDSLPRSQYDRYAALRGRHRPANEINLYGRREKALRSRLRPLGEP
jgi:hypothetical protein